MTNQGLNQRYEWATVEVNLRNKQAKYFLPGTDLGEHLEPFFSK